MALYSEGVTVFTNKSIGTPASGDHPAFHHANAGDEFVVIRHNPEYTYSYLIGKSLDDKEPFWVGPNDLMSQRPFKHN